MRSVTFITFVCTLYTQLSMYSCNGYQIAFPPSQSSPCLSYPCQTYQSSPCRTGPCQSSYPCKPYPVKCNDCQYPSTCVNATTIPYCAKELANSSPKYGSSVPDTPFRLTSDGSCYTYIDAGYGIYLHFRTIVSKTGYINIRKYLVADVSGFPGRLILIGTVNITGNSVIVGNEYLIAQAKRPCDTQAFYRCNVYQTCSAVDDLGTYSNIFVLSNSPYAPNSCVKEVLQKVYDSRDGFNISGFFSPPFNNLKCVCSFNGINVINRQSIPNRACLTLPD